MKQFNEEIRCDDALPSGARKIATWTGNIRVRQDEGWLEADRLDAAMSGDGQGLKSMSATGSVRLEYRVRSDSGIPERVQGDGDRTEFDPVAGILRLFGDSRQATLRKTGKNALTLSGRILRYYVGDGAIEVEKGLSGYSTIQTSDPGEETTRGESDN